MSTSRRPEFPDEAFKLPLLAWSRAQYSLLKGVYLPTGSGKTHAAQSLVIDIFAGTGAIPVYVAPIKRLIEDFEPGVRKLIAESGRPIPVYRIYAREDFANDDTLLAEAVPFCLAARRYLAGAHDLLDDDFNELPADGETVARGYSAAEWLRRTENAVTRYRRLHEFLRISPTDQQLSEELRQAMGTIIAGLNALSRKIVVQEIMNGYRDKLFENPDLRPMLLKLRPLDLFQYQPGIIIATTSKFASRCIQYELTTEKLGIPKPKSNPYETFFEWASKRHERFALLIDEEEEAHEFLFKALKRDLTNRDVDLHRVIYAFFHHFDLSGFSDYADYESEAFARRLFDSSSTISANLGVIRKILLESCNGEEQITQLQALPCFSGFEPAWLQVLAEDFFAKHDIHNNFTKLREKLKIIDAIKIFAREAVQPWPDATVPQTEFDVYRRLQRVFHDKKHILANAATLRDFSGELEYLFFNERLEFFEHQVLERIRLVPSVAHNNLELVSADALLHDGNLCRQRNSFSLGEFLRFVMAITRILLHTPIKEPAKEKTGKITDHQWSVLRRYRQKIGGWKLNKDDLPSQAQRAPDEPLTDEMVFRRSKFALSIVEDTMLREEYANDLRIMSIATTVLRKTPEDMLDAFLTAKRREFDDLPGNIAYLMSATGGMHGCRGGFNLPYLATRLKDVDGRVERASDAEYCFMADFRHYRQALRTTRVQDFDRDTFLSRVEPGALYHRLEREMMNELEAAEPGGRGECNPHKLDELRYFAALLCRLATGQERSAIAFTQTVSKIRAIVDGLARRQMGVTADESIRGLYTLNPAAFGQPGDKVRLILYTAGFGKEPGRIVDGDFRPFGEDEIDEDNEESILESLLDETEQKVLMISGFRSASRGLNLTPKHPGPEGRAKNGTWRKDFDILMVAMSPYYDGLYRVPDLSLVHMERLQAMLQHLYLEDRLVDYTYQELPAAIANEHEEAFRDEYFRKIGRDMVQTIGRVERVETGVATQSILINHEIVLELAQFYKLEPDFSRRLSAGNHAVYEHVQAFMKRTSMFSDESGWNDYVRQEIVQGASFLKASRRIYRGFRNKAYREAWVQIRSQLMFTDPAAYLESLQSPPAGVDARAWRSFVDYAFVANDHADRYILRADKAIESIDDAENALGEAVCDVAQSVRGQLAFYADLHHSKGRRFDPGWHLAPVGLRATPEFQEIMKALKIDLDHLFQDQVPRAQFFNDYVKGYFAELVMSELLRRRGITTIDAVTHPHAEDLFERFDEFVETESRVYAIDLKNWSRRADRLAGRSLRNNASRKAGIVQAALQIPMTSQRKALIRARQVERLLDNKPVVPLYVNLCGERPYGTEVLEGRRIHFFNLFVAEIDDDGWSHYRINERLLRLLDPTPSQHA